MIEQAKSNSLRQRYESLKADRQPFLDRARSCAKLTIPSLMPPDGHTGSGKLDTPYQSDGARCLNSLAARLLTSQLPTNTSFFRLQLSDHDLNQLGVEKRGAVEAAFASIERTALAEVESQAVRVPIHEALRQLVMGGNALLVWLQGKGLRCFRLDRYVAVRDPMGNIIEMLTHEQVAPSTLPSDLREAIEVANKLESAKGQGSQKKTLDLYTRMKLDGDRWVMSQEVCDFPVPKSTRTYAKDKCPWLPLRFNRIDGESYGRGLVEEYFGDLRSLETLTKAIVQGAVAAAKILLLVKPNGMTKVREVKEAENGAVIAGDATDVTVLQMDKRNDFSVAHQLKQEIVQSLNQAFMTHGSVQRKGERVTAEEIRYMAQELEGALGGLYSLLALELQLPLVRLVLADLERRRKIPKLPADQVKPHITTGIEALGRGTELTRLGQLLQMLAPLGPDVIKQEMNVGDYIDRLGANIGIDMKGLIKTPEQKQQEAQQQQQMMQMQQMMDMAGKAAPAIAKGVMDSGKPKQGGQGR